MHKKGLDVNFSRRFFFGVGPTYARHPHEHIFFPIIIIFSCDFNTVCPGSSDPFYIVSYYIKWVTTSWTHSIYRSQVLLPPSPEKCYVIFSFFHVSFSLSNWIPFQNTVCPGSSGPFYIVTYYVKWVTTSWTYCM